MHVRSDASEPREPPAAVTVVNEAGASPYILTCEHASNHMPARYGRLGLSDEDMRSHIAWDIGAALLARRLSDLLDAPLFLSGYSRLLIDCNRPPGSRSSIPAQSESIEIPGNRGLTAADIEHREKTFFRPFQERIMRVLDDRQTANRASVILGIHSFTPTYLGIGRIWHVGILHGESAELASQLIEGFRRDSALVVGDNEPYRIDPKEDYTVPVHGDARGIPAVLIEVRNDLLASAGDIESWAGRIAGILPTPG
jgi:predicted N-formylglutamate amidohydrolase